MKKFYSAFEEGIEVTMWQYNRTEFSEIEEFPVKGVPIQLQFRRHGELLVQAILAFKMKGGYFSNALSRHKGMEVTNIYFAHYHRCGHFNEISDPS